MPYQFNVNAIKASGLYHYNGTTLLNAPSSSQNFRTIEIGRVDRYSQIALPWEADTMLFRRHRENNFTPWMQVTHSGDISTFIQLGEDTLSAVSDKSTN